MIRILIGVTVLALLALVYISSESPEGPLHHISQQEANAYCASGIAYPEQSTTEGVTDGRPDVHSYYPCSDGSTVPAYRS